MLERYFDSGTVDRLRGELPLGPHLEGVAASLTDQGYAMSTVRLQIEVVARLGRFLAERQVAVEDLDESTVDVFLDEVQGAVGRRRGDRAVTCRLLEQLREQGVIGTAPERNRPEHGFAEIEGRYEQFLRTERGVTTATVLNYLPFVRRFLEERFGEGPRLLADLRPPDASRFIVRHADSMSKGRAKLMVSALRSFLRFLLEHGEIEVDLAASVPGVCGWRQAGVPQYISRDDVERMIDGVSQETAVGRRNRAILLLLSRLGLRAGEVVAMELEDIDWRSGEITIRGKGGRQDELPLTTDVGEALTSYLRRDRPRCTSRRVFIRARAPHRGFRSSAAITTIVERVVAHAGLNPPARGAHLLRHSLATGMLGRGASMAEIGQVLRHRSATSTEIYAKVDLEGLRSIAQPWPAAAKQVRR